MEQNEVQETQRKLTQAQHRLEEQQARDRVKERKARTRRLIERGAILEKYYPEAKNIDNETLEKRLAVIFKNL